MIGDEFNLQRFVDAQNRGGAYEQALTELRAGRKQGHWTWFVFPQIEGLGSSGTARLYAITSLSEAAAYLAHPVLGPRLIVGAEVLLALDTRDPDRVLGELGAIKLRSSMTLFAQVEAAGPVFRLVLDEFYAGAVDSLTEERLRAGTGSASSCARDRRDTRTGTSP
jgi:uncharacterized protein (DUF1810 family)